MVKFCSFMLCMRHLFFKNGGPCGLHSVTMVNSENVTELKLVNLN